MPAAYLVGGSGHTAGLINQGEDSQRGVDWGPLQQIQADLIVYELNVAPVNALSSILLLQNYVSVKQLHIMIDKIYT